MCPRTVGGSLGEDGNASFPHLTGGEVVSLKTPLLALGFLIHQILLHYLIFRLQPGVTVSTRYRTSAIIHWNRQLMKVETDRSLLEIITAVCGH